MNGKRLLSFILSMLAVGLIIFGIGLGEILSNVGKIPVDASKKLPSWDKDVVKAFGRIAVQEDGRLKPLETLANFKMLRYHGSRTMRLKYTDDTKRTLSPTEWLLDCLFFPENAKHYPTFVVDDPGAVTAIGAKAHDSRRLRYSYEELLPARAKLLEMATQFGKIEAKKRDPIQGMIVKLADDVADFERIIGSLTWAREGMPLAADEKATLAEALKDGKLPYSTYLKAMKGMGRVSRLEELPKSIRDDAVSSALLTVYPHFDSSNDIWASPSVMIVAGLVQPDVQDKAIKDVEDWENLAALAGKPGLSDAIKKLAGELKTEVESRGEYWRIPLEAAYNRVDFFYRALLFFVVAFILLAISWLNRPDSLATRVLTLSSWACMVVGLALLVTGMLLRCVIMDRWMTAFVTNLYETILFISAFVVLVGLAAELITKRRIALPVTAFLATLGMFLSMKYEAKEATDTLAKLQAVLNTNYWLSIHVTTVNIGYAAGLLAAAFSGVYLVARLFDPRREDKELFSTLTRCAYGIVCFGLFFSLVGTVLGGLWANDSWGRFWGWDPKENGALMIVLAFLIILHARVGGYVKEFGLHFLTLLTGNIVVFSWWHVNLLGVGLHSYGFTSGILPIIIGFYITIGLVTVLGFFAWLMSLAAKPVPAPPPKPPSDSPPPESSPFVGNAKAA